MQTPDLHRPLPETGTDVSALESRLHELRLTEQTMQMFRTNRPAWYNPVEHGKVEHEINRLESALAGLHNGNGAAEAEPKRGEENGAAAPSAETPRPGQMEQRAGDARDVLDMRQRLMRSARATLQSEQFVPRAEEHNAACLLEGLSTNCRTLHDWQDASARLRQRQSSLPVS